MNFEDTFSMDIDHSRIEERIEKLQERSQELKDKELFKKIFSLIDLTSLSVSDHSEKINIIVEKVNKLKSRYSDLPNVAAICVFPVFISLVRETLKDHSVRIASVAGSFPTSQTFTEIKVLEIQRAIEEGADEIDIVLPVGKFLSGKYDQVRSDLIKAKEAAGKNTLKVILETGEIKDLKLVYYASLISLESGADFIKTSTGKTETGATPEAVYIMCEAIKKFKEKTQKIAGIKPAGGISEVSTAILYYLIVNEVLGNEWLKPERFRIGASRLANKLLGDNYF